MNAGLGALLDRLPAAPSARLLLLRLDRFRMLDNARGRDVGDLVLAEVGRRLLEVCPPGGQVGRVDRDGFAVLSVGTEPDHLPGRLLRVLAEPFVVEGGPISITASIGVAAATPGVPAGVLLQRADIALEHARQSGGDRISLYTQAMMDAEQERFALEQSLRDNIGSRAFRLVYQPIVDIEQDRVVGFEALLRWTDPVHGDISPGLFIPIAEATGSIVPLGQSALDAACVEAAGWTNGRTIAVNLSPVQLRDRAIVATVRDVLARSGLAPARLELEVTEGMLLENTDAVRENLAALGRLGVTLTLDDFGAGHAGLSYLGRFPFQKLKIDGSFIRRLGRDREADAIVEAVLLIGRRLALSVIAESVETVEQLERLRAMKCRLVQGFLTGRPMEAAAARVLP